MSRKSIALIIILIIFLQFFVFAKNTSAAVISRPPTNLGLVGYWPMDEGVGSKAGDMSGGGNTGTINGATWTSGKRGGALGFDGNSSVGIQNAPFPMRGTNTMTASAWVKRQAANSTGGILNYSTEFAFGIGVTPCSGSTVKLTKYGVVDICIGSFPSDTKFHHLTAVWSSGGVSLYIDGVLNGTHSNTANFNNGATDNLYIGYASNDNAYFNGLIDDVRVYNRALTATEVSKMYSSGQVTSKKVSESGLVGYWAMNEGQGSKAGDSSGNNKNASLYGGISWAGGKKGNSLNFNGVDSYFDSPSFSLIDVNGDISVSFWMKTSSSTKATILNKGGGSGRLWIWHEGGKIAVNSYFGTGKDYYLYGNINVIDNKWHNIVVVFEKNGNEKIYVDGVFDNQTSIAGAVSDSWSQNSFLIGKTLNITYWQYYDGLIDDVRIYNRALSATEIQNLYKQNETMVNAPQNDKLTNGLVGFWSFNGKDVSGTTAYDRSGNGNHGTITGAKLDAGKVGQGLDFNGINNNVLAVNPFTGNDFTISLWLNPSVINTGLYQGFIGRQSPSGGWAYRAPSLWVAPSSGGIHYDSYDISGVRYSRLLNNFFTSQNEWVCVSWVKKGTTYDIYKNGIIFASGLSAPASLYISGSDYGIGMVDNYFKGKIDEVRIYNRALSAEEIKQLYLMGK